MIACTRLRSVPPDDPTVAVVFTHDAHEIERQPAAPGQDAARAAIILICKQGDRGLIAGDRLRVIHTGDVDGAPLPPPRVKQG